MKKSVFMAIGLATVLFSFTACEKESLDSTEVSVTERAPLAVDFEVNLLGKSSNASLPQTIRELRNAGVRVSGSLASFVRTLENLIAASELSLTAEGRDELRRRFFFESEIVELQRINKEYNELVNNGGPDPVEIPELSAEFKEFVARYDIPDNIIVLIARANSFDALLAIETELLTTTISNSNIVQLGPNAFEVDQSNSQGTQVFRVVIDRDELSGKFFNQAYFVALIGDADIDRNSAPNLNEVLKRMSDRTVDALFGPL